MDVGWRRFQIDYNVGARERMAKSGGTRLWAWEIIIMFYEIVTTVDEYAEMRGIPVPESHRARRAVVERHLPHLLDPYDDLYTLSLAARYYGGYAMTEKAWRKAAQCRETLARSIPVRQRPDGVR